MKKEGVLLEKTALPFENEGVLNPATIREGNYVHMFYRAVRNGNFSSIESKDFTVGKGTPRHEKKSYHQRKVFENK